MHPMEHLLFSCRHSRAMMMRFMMCVAYIMKQRCTRLAVLRRTAALAAGVAAVEVACADVPVARQHIDRALGGWRGSTVSGYLRGADKPLGRISVVVRSL